MKLDMVGCAPSDLLGVLMDLHQKLLGNEGSLWLERLKRFLKCENPFETSHASAESPVEGEAWKQELMDFARRKLRKFFGRGVVVDPVPESWTPERLATWAKYNLRPVFFAPRNISQAFQWTGWTKFRDWFYVQAATGAVKGNKPTCLRPGWYLADFTVGVDYTDGTQVMVNDPWATLIGRLRAEGKIGAYANTPPKSRFAITPIEWDTVVLPAMATELGLLQEEVWMERAVDFNAIGNIYDQQRGQFNMWEWFADPFEVAKRLYGGRRDRGGLAVASYDGTSIRSSSTVARPLVSFVP